MAKNLVFAFASLIKKQAKHVTRYQAIKYCKTLLPFFCEILQLYQQVMKMQSAPFSVLSFFISQKRKEIPAQRSWSTFICVLSTISMTTKWSFPFKSLFANNGMTRGSNLTIFKVIQIWIWMISILKFLVEVSRRKYLV